ncbi:hypothetical protein SAMN04489712_12416 [Thermomonospora echinospora]|uniref:Lipoprotein n=1 Tax=Thermomonospora echinospora TaxID=1992 RepID=A0A1H6DWD7_9ACTN|nr:hypothetical protein [Thermomonospora echinospora]SEG89647.1 hypothetical protein SAMN04489712_12416 [Thermomonospora echinospora]
MHTPKPLALASLLLAGALAVGCDPGDAAAPTAGSATPRPTATTSPNGVERLSAAEIFQRAERAALSASSMRMRGHVVEEGEKAELNFRYSGGRAAMGDVTVRGDMQVNLTRIGSTLYLKGNDEFWREAGGPSAVNLLSGKYFKTSTKDKDLAELISFTDPAKMFDDLLKPEGELTKGATARINGRAAIGLEDGSGGTLYVATEGDPHVLRLDAGPDVLIDFSGHEEPVTIGPPPAGQVIDTDELEG